MKRSVYSFRHIRNLALIIPREHRRKVSYHSNLDETWDTDDFFVVYIPGYFKPGTNLRKKVSEKIGLEVLETGKGGCYSITYFTHEVRVMEVVKIKALKCVLALRVNKK
jgi:hypothetical protein